MNKKIKNEELGRLNITDFKSADKSPIYIVIDNLRSLNNIGSIFRTADAFRVKKIYICGISATPPHKEIHKTALGATESVAWEYFEKTEHCIRFLQQKSIECFALEQTKDSVSLDQFSYPTGKEIAIVLGNEVEGVQQAVVNLCEHAIEIPQYGTKHSFNVSVSNGICLWEIFQKWKDTL